MIQAITRSPAANSARAHTRLRLPRCVPDGVPVLPPQLLGRAPSDLRLEDIDVAFLGRFLEHWSLNERTAFGPATTGCPRYAPSSVCGAGEPAFALQCQRILAIPSKRYERRPVEFLTEEESAALITAPDRTTWNWTAGQSSLAGCRSKPASETARSLH